MVCRLPIVEGGGAHAAVSRYTVARTPIGVRAHHFSPRHVHGRYHDPTLKFFMEEMSSNGVSGHNKKRAPQPWKKYRSYRLARNNYRLNLTVLVFVLFVCGSFSNHDVHNADHLMSKGHYGFHLSHARKEPIEEVLQAPFFSGLGTQSSRNHGCFQIFITMRDPRIAGVTA